MSQQVFRNGKQSPEDMKLLVISPGPAISPEHDEWKRKNISEGIIEGIKKESMNGYFKKVYAAFFFSPKRQVIEVDDITIIYSGLVDVIETTPFYKQTKLRKVKKYVHMMGPRKIKQYISMVFELKRIIETENITFISAADPHLSGITAYFLSKLTNRPFIVSLWNSYDYIYKYGKWTTTGLPRFIEKIMERLVFRRADMIWGLNNNLKEYAIKNGADIEKCYTVRICVDPSHYSMEGRKDIRDELGVNKESEIIVYVGRLSPEKLPLDVVKAFNIIASRRKNVYLFIAGDGILREDIEDYAGKHGLASKVTILGFKDQTFLRNLYYTADVVISPLTGSSLVEACLSGTPVVAYDFDWQPEIIKHMVTGLLIDFGDIEQLAEATIFLLENPEISSELGANARVFATFQHSWNNAFQERIRLYEKLRRQKNEKGGLSIALLFK